MNFKIEKLIPFLIAALIFGPHRIGENFQGMQELFAILIAFISLIKFKLNKNIFILLILILSINILFIFSSIIHGNFSFILIFRPIKYIIYIFTGLAIRNLNINEIYKTSFISLLFSIFNSLILISQIFIPPLRTFFSFRELRDNGGFIAYVFRFSGMADDGYQITTLSSLFIIIIFHQLLYKYKIYKKKYVHYIFLIANIILPISWFCQGRVALFFALLFLPSYYLYFYWKRIVFNPFTLPAILSFSLITITSFNLLKTNFGSLFLVVNHSLKLIQNPLNDTSTKYLLKGRSTVGEYDYQRSFLAPFIGDGLDGRGGNNLQNPIRGNFDNGYQLGIFQYGIIGYPLLVLLTFLLSFCLEKPNSFSYFYIFIYLLLHFKEGALFSGSFFAIYFLLSKVSKKKEFKSF